jgi:hypothetical protein
MVLLTLFSESLFTAELESFPAVLESLLLLQDQTASADKQMAKERSFFFINEFCRSMHKIYASPSARRYSLMQPAFGEKTENPAFNSRN